MNSDTDKIFDAFLRASEVVHKAHTRRIDIEQAIEGSKPKCGNCFHWMKKRSCPAEAQGDKRSMEGLSCSKFTRTKEAEEHLEKLQELRGSARYVADGGEEGGWL